jgi:hypothetical protein
LESDKHSYKPKSELLDLLDEPGKIFTYDSYNHVFSARMIDFDVAFGFNVTVKFLAEVYRRERKMVRTCLPGDDGCVLIVMNSPIGRYTRSHLLGSFGSIFKQVIYETYLPQDLELVDKRWVYVKSDYSRTIDLELSHFATVSQTDIVELMHEASDRPGVESVSLSDKKADCITAKFYNPINPEHMNLTVGMLTAKIFLLLTGKRTMLAATT